MAKDGTVTVKITGDSKGLKNALDDSDGHLNKFGGKLGGVAAGVGKAFVGMGAAAGAFGVLSVKAFMEAEQVTAQTGAVLKSTGGIANVTAKDVDTLAGSLSKMSGVDDEAIASGQNLLLTFTKVRNEVGKGNDIFNQGTKAALDMSVAMGTDMTSASMLVGKALNDPVKGMTALTKSGIQFTDQQKEQIKALVASGDTLGAQKIILKELETQFGGSAKAAGDTFAGQINKLKVTVGNFMEAVGAKLVPILMQVGKWFGDRIPAAIATLTPYMRTLTDALKSLGAWAQDTLLPALQKLWSFIQDNVQPVLAALAVVVGAVLVGAVMSLAASLAALLSPVVLVIAAVAAVAAGLVYAYKHFEGFRDVVDKVAAFLKDTVLPAIGAFVGYIITQFGNLVNWVKQFWPQISEAIGHVMVVIRETVQVILGVLAALWRAWGDDIFNYVKTIFNFIRETIENAINVIRGIIQVVVALINGDWGKAWEGLKGIVGAVWDQIKNIISTAIGVVKSLLGGLASTIGQVALGMWDPIREGFKSIINWIIDRWNGLEFKMPGLGPIPGYTIEVPDIPRLHSGGIVPGIPGSDVLTMLQAGERVIPRGGGGATTVVNYYLNATSLSPAEASELIMTGIREYERRNGQGWRT